MAAAPLVYEWIGRGRRVPEVHGRGAQPEATLLAR
jgi:hypothetical protein